MEKRQNVGTKSAFTPNWTLFIELIKLIVMSKLFWVNTHVNPNSDQVYL